MEFFGPGTWTLAKSELDRKGPYTPQPLVIRRHQTRLPDAAGWYLYNGQVKEAVPKG